MGLRHYVRGDSLNMVAWKQWAQGKGMQVKQFHQPQGIPQWLTLPPLTGQAKELAISQLTYKINELIQQQICVGLAIDDLRLEPDNSESHRIRCLQALASVPMSRRDIDE
nr:DUF58 domain-containing protein [Shewanella sp. NIFS-20-20]